jgi:hypothetical protein
MQDDRLSVTVTRKWQLAESYHAVELQTRFRSELPSFDDGACVTLVLDKVISRERTYPLCRSASRPGAYVIAVRQDNGESDTETEDISLSQGDEAFIVMSRSPTVILDGRTRSRKVKSSNCTTSLVHLSAQSFGKNLTRSNAKARSITILA